MSEKLDHDEVYASQDSQLKEISQNSVEKEIIEHEKKQQEKIVNEEDSEKEVNI